MEIIPEIDDSTVFIDQEKLNELQILVNADLEKIELQRSLRPELPKTQRYKRDWYDSLADLHLLDAEKLIIEYFSICDNKSKLAKNLREIVVSIVGNSIPKILEVHQD